MNVNVYEKISVINTHNIHLKSVFKVYLMRYKQSKFWT
jgi:hypothetical protein